MSAQQPDEREARAARNQAVFRKVNETLRELNGATVPPVGTFVIACECAHIGCIDMVTLRREEYEAVRRHDRHFVVRRGHEVLEVEDVVAGFDGCLIVEKRGLAGAIAEATAGIGRTES